VAAVRVRFSSPIKTVIVRSTRWPASQRKPSASSRRICRTGRASRRRSTRSTSTPPGRANSSQGSHATPVVAETISGFLVCAATKSGAAIVARPLPRADVVLAVHSLANREPSGSATSSDATRALAAACPAVRPPADPVG